jgi:hypothetical protein
MKNGILKEIMDIAVKKLTDAYGYCGCADSDNKAFLNSDNKNGNDIKIILSLEKDEMEV